jgi:hypothetical protein
MMWDPLAEPRREIVMTESLSSLPLESWSDTRTTLHLYTQIVGKVRLALALRSTTGGT